MVILFSILPPVVAIIYKILDYLRIIDKATRRTLRISGLKRLKFAGGYPTSLITLNAKDRNEFDALLKIIRRKTNSVILRKLIKMGCIPTLIATAGSAIAIPGLPDNWTQDERFFISSEHPVLIMFGVDIGVNNSNGQGKAIKACTIGELERWIEDEKRNREFWLGTILSE